MEELTTSACAWRDWEYPQRTSNRKPRDQAEIRTKHLPNTNLQRYRSVWRVTQYSLVHRMGYLITLFQVKVIQQQ
jgi:hypothetical protein